MGYLVDFEKAIENHDAPAILRLWEEYTSSDEVDAEDFKAILEIVKTSDLRDYIGRHVERGVFLWEKIDSSAIKDDILRLIVDLQITNDPTLRQMAVDFLKRKFGEEKQFSEKIRLIGLQANKGNFQGAISHYLLLNHMEKGNFVFHNAGWGVGEIVDISMLREQLSLEFDYAPGRKDMPFTIAFITLIPIPNTHFLAERFGSPDQLEEKAKKNPLEVMRMLLKDLGPKTAADIKDELCGLVIPETEWNRWWQTARAKMKKDTRIENPVDLKKPFRLLKDEVSHEERLQKELETKPDADTLIQMMHNFLKDFPETLKNASFKNVLINKLKELLSFKELTIAQELQIHLFLQDLIGEKEYTAVPQLFKKLNDFEKIVKEISVQALKKKMLVEVREIREDWQEIFLNLLFVVDQSHLRDYIFAELLQSEAAQKLHKKMQDLSAHPYQCPDAVIWYFQKVMENVKLPFGDAEGRSQFFQALLILLSCVEQKGERRDLVKKIHAILSEGRYAIVRQVMKESSVEETQEFLLLITKCHSLSDHDIKIFYSLAEVAHPSLKKKRKKEVTEEEECIWTTKEGYFLLQKKIEQIGTVETVDNAKEIEIARAHGDLRENAEFKAALERRDRLQAELKFLSDQLNKSRVLTREDIDLKKVGVGTIVDCENEKGEKVTYTLLGPWDANPEANILSFQSKLAMSMMGLQKGSSFELQGKKFTISNIRSAL